MGVDRTAKRRRTGRRTKQQRILFDQSELQRTPSVRHKLTNCVADVVKPILSGEAETTPADDNDEDNDDGQL